MERENWNWKIYFWILKEFFLIHFFLVFWFLIFDNKIIKDPCLFLLLLLIIVMYNIISFLKINQNWNNHTNRNQSNDQMSIKFLFLLVFVQWKKYSWFEYLKWSETKLIFDRNSFKLFISIFFIIKNKVILATWLRNLPHTEQKEIWKN